MKLLEKTPDYKKYSVKLKAIKPCGKDIVYDIEVDKAHRILANGFYTSNRSHPDLIDFIKIKSNYTAIQNANISVQISEDFYRCVEQDKEWEMTFEVPCQKKGDKIYVDVHSADKTCLKDDKGYYKIVTHDRESEIIKRSMPARDILMLIAENMKNNAEPGIQNIDIARKFSNSDYLYDPNAEYDTRIMSTNACSEQYLSRESLCVLSSINMGKFSTDQSEYKIELERISESITRFLDNVNECELVYQTYATYHQKLAIEQLRRTGAGITNIGAWLFKLNLEYGSDESNEKVENFLKEYNYNLYKSSINLGKEKGSFGAFNKEKYIKSPFIKNMMKTFPDLTFDTMRNVTVSSIAPTGCTIKETEIITTDGIKTIKEIFEENDIDINKLEKTDDKQWFDLIKPIYVLNMNNEIQKVTKLFYNGRDIVKTIKFKNGDKFTGTHTTHKILVKSKEKKGYGIWKTLDTITEEDEIIIEK